MSPAPSRFKHLSRHAGYLLAERMDMVRSSFAHLSTVFLSIDMLAAFCYMCVLGQLLD